VAHSQSIFATEYRPAARFCVMCVAFFVAFVGEELSTNLKYKYWCGQ